jgi:hypothetical protein
MQIKGQAERTAIRVIERLASMQEEQERQSKMEAPPARKR